MKKLLSVLLAYAVVLTLLPSTLPVLAAETATVSQQAAATSNSILDEVPVTLKGTDINMLIWWTKDEDDQMKAAEFTKETGIDVSYETAALDKYQTQLATKIMAQNSPSLAAMINEWYPLPITRGLFQPIYAVDGWDWSDDSVYATNLMDQFSYKGIRYGIQLKSSAQNTFYVMFFNKDMLRSFGIKQDPYELWKAGKWNWDTCLSIASKCTREDLGVSGISNVYMHSWMLSAGEDYVKNTETGLVNNIRSSGVLNAWNWNWDLINTYKVVDTSYTGHIPFYQGKAALLGAGSYAMLADSDYNYVPQNMGDEWGVVPFPSPAGRTAVGSEGTVWGFPSRVKGDELQAAAWYLRYYLDDFNIDFIRDDLYDPDHPECMEIMEWMWNQEIQSFNSVGVLTYSGVYNQYAVQYSLVDEADRKVKLKMHLESWYSVFDANLSNVEKEAVAYNCTEHIYTDKCDMACNKCGAERTVTHKYSGKCDATCNNCGYKRSVDSASATHTYTNACDKSCNVCSATRTIKHDYKAATCTKAKTCKVCGVTSGSKLGHKYTNSCDTSCNTCKATRKITHKYTTVTKKATTSANGYTVKRCSVCKKETGKTTIYKANKVTLSKTTYTYNGKAQKPTVTVKDAKGNKIATSNYTVTYASGRKNVGTYKVTIKFKGKYSGTKTLTFKINPVKTTVSKLTAAKKSLKVTITKKTTQVTGYEVQYATNKNFTSAKTKTLTSYKKNTLTLSGLTAKKTYYVRVRTYKTVNGKKVYSAWSAAKSMKTK